MDIGIYQERSRETAIYDQEVDRRVDFTMHDEEAAALKTDLRIFYVTLGLAGEAGELANKAKKLIRDADSHDKVAEIIVSMIEELGDIMWYVAAVAHELGADLDEICKENLKKLSSRKCRGVLKGSGDER